MNHCGASISIDLGNAVTGDFGPSYVYKDNTVAQLIGKGLPYSLELGSYALLLALVGGVLAGTLAALRQNSAFDFSIMSISTVGVTVPNFVVAPVLTLVFAVILGFCPPAAGAMDRCDISSSR